MSSIPSNGPTAQQLRDMARAFPGGEPSPQRDVTPDGKVAEVRPDGVYVDEVRIFGAEQVGSPLLNALGAGLFGSDEMGGPLQDGLRNALSLPPTVALNAAGDVATFQIPLEDGVISLQGGTVVPSTQLVHVRVKKGWLGTRVSAPEPAFNSPFPEPARALDVGTEGNVALAFGSEVVEFDGRTSRQVIATPRPIADVEYLSDGSLAICTEPGPGGREYYLAPRGSGPAVPVSLKDIDADAFSRSVCRQLPWSGATPGDLEAFRRSCPWIFNADGTVKPHGCELSPTKDRAVVVVPDPLPRVWLYETATRSSKALGQVDEERLEDLHLAWDQASGTVALWDGKAEAATVHAWNAQTGDKTLLPLVRELRCDASDLVFRPATDAAEVRVPLSNLASATQQPWYPGALAAYRDRLQASVAGNKTATIRSDTMPTEVADGYIIVNGVRLERKQP